MTTYRLSLRCETATFVHGGRGVAFADLHASAFKWGMRYWFRAFSGLSLEELRIREREVFGGVGDPHPRCSVAVHLGQPYREVATRSISEIPHKETRQADDKRPKLRPLSSAIRAGTDFELSVSGDDIVLRSLWMSLAVGGIGARVRRGCGSVRILRIVPETDICPVAEVFADPAQLGEFLTGGFQAAGEHFSRRGLRRVGDLVPYPSMLLPGARIAVLPFGEGDEAEVRAQLYLRLREFKNPVFGLPLKVADRWVRGPSRFASPVWLRPVRCESEWAVICTVLRPVPEVEGSDPHRIDEFLGSFGQPAAEVELPGGVT